MKYKTVLPVLAALFFGIGLVFGSQAAKYQDPIVNVMYSQLLSSAFIFVFIKIKGVKTDWKSLKVFRKEILQAAIAGVLALTFTFWGLSLTNPIKAQFILKLEVALILIIGFFLGKERIKFRQVLFILALLFGSFLLLTSGNLQEFKNYVMGDLVVILATVSYACMYFPIRKIVGKVNPIFYSFILNISEGLITLPIVLFFKPIESAMIALPGLYFIFGYSVLSMVVANILWVSALKYNKPWIVSSLLLLQPIFGGIFAFLWLSYTLSIIQLVGAAFIILASLFIIKENS